VGTWYWCTDQYIVQRALSANGIQEGRRGAIFGGFLKLLPVFLFLIPGVTALALKNQGKLHWEAADQAFATLLMNTMPSGLRGLVAAGLLAALMSSLASVFNSCSTLFTVDIYKKLRPNAPENKLLNVGRIATAIVVVFGIIWIPIMQNISGVLYEYLQSVQSYIAPPITAVFLLGIFFKRINANGAFATLLLGLVVTILRLTLELTGKGLSQDSFLYQFGQMNFLTFGSWFFLFCVAVAVVVSLLTPAQSIEKIAGLTYDTLTEEQKAASKNTYNWVDIASSIFVILIVAYIMMSFAG
jgi:SSS family solute:Na+ symporter